MVFCEFATYSAMRLTSSSRPNVARGSSMPSS
jgi:hypothetical protein